MLIAVGIILITLAYPISQTATLFAVSWGVLYFKEIVHRRHTSRIIIGAGLIMCGAGLLTMA
ncbi:Uncharacterised protein [uncultured archaeon]|nr:Uncharacterised protein [uncultured archaeon]